jgi:Ca-activated chloride channel family protein
MALAVTVALDVVSIRPREDTRAHAVIVLEARGEPRHEPRAPSRTVLALDVSGSMAGEPIDQVIRSVDALLDAFGPDDEVGVVAFSDGASCVVEPVRVDDEGKRLVRARVRRLEAKGNTDVEAGLDLAASLLASAPTGMRRGVVLLSDGAPNRGAHTAEALRDVVRRHRPNVSFFSLGYGQNHCEDVLAAVGDAGGGGYELVVDPRTCARAFARALGAQADVVASGIELVIGPAEGADVAGLLGREEMRFSRDGVVVALPDMVAGARRVVVVELAIRAPGAQRFLAHVADVTVRTKAGAPARHALDVEVADRDPQKDAAAMRDVLLVRADRVREEARALADRGRFGAAAAGLRKLLDAIGACPGFVANDGSPLAEAYEVVVDEAVAMERRPAGDEYAAFRKAAVASKAAASGPESARLRGAMSTRLIEQAAGDYPAAWLVTPEGVRHRLREECVIGRTASADVCLASDGVSRRHAEVVAIDGRFLVVDLGSTNPTSVNGEPLGRVPRPLRDGDVVRVGDVELRYEQPVRSDR